MDCSRVDRTLYSLLRMALWGGGAEVLGASGLTPDEWQAVHDAARQQTVLALAADALQRLPDTLLPPDTLLLRWLAEADRIERRSRAMDDTVLSLVGLLRREGLHPVVLKGQGVARLYPNPLLRQAGDADLFFPVDGERAEAERLLEADGNALDRLPDGSTYTAWHGVEIELHPRLFDLCNPRVQPLLKLLQRQQGFVEQPLRDGMSITVPAPQLNLLLLCSHILKHAIGHGVGLRQLCDMALAFQAWPGAVDAALLRSLGLARWTRLLAAFLVGRLGLPAECSPVDVARKDFRPLERIVMEGGNFGFLRRRASEASAFARKLATARAFVSHTGFSMRHAPSEAFWTFATLLGGQMKC